MTNTQEDDTIELSQSSYRGTPYQDASWEIVGDFLNQISFEPLGFQVINSRAMSVDPMFADYGGLPPGGTDTRFHGGGDSRYDPVRRQTRGGAAAADEFSQEHDDQIAALAARHEQELAAARAEAFEEGKLAAIAEVDERMKTLEERYGTVLEDVGAQINENLTVMEQQAVTLAISIAHKLVGTIVDINPEYILGIVREAISHSGGATIKEIRVSPQDHEFLRLLNLPKQFKDYDGTWNFEADEGVKSGCIVVTSGGEVDFQLDPAWERIRDSVAKVTAR